MPSASPETCRYRPLALLLLALLTVGLCPLARATTGHHYWAYVYPERGLFVNYPYGYHRESFRWRVTLSQPKAVNDAAVAKAHPPVHIAEMNGLIARAVQAIQPIARKSFPPDSTEAQKQLFEERQLGQIKRIASKLLGRAVSIPLIIQGVSTTNGGQYAVVARLAWKPAMRLTPAQRLQIERQRQLAHAEGSSADTEIAREVARWRATVPANLVTFHTDRQGVLAWHVGDLHDVYAVITGVRDISTQRPYVTLSANVRLLSFRVPQMSPPAGGRQSAVPRIKFILLLASGGRLQATMCVLRGGVYHIVSMGMKMDLPAKQVLRVTPVPKSSATAKK